VAYNCFHSCQQIYSLQSEDTKMEWQEKFKNNYTLLLQSEPVMENSRHIMFTILTELYIKSNLVTGQCSKEQKPHKSITLYNLLSSVKENKSHRPSFSSHWVEEKQNSTIYACKWLACTLSPNCRIEDRLGTGKVSEKWVWIRNRILNLALFFSHYFTLLFSMLQSQIQAKWTRKHA